MKELLGHNKYIFFLQLGVELPSYYSRFAELFAKLDISLVPISIKDLLTIKKAQKIPHIIVIASDLESMRKLRILQQKILNFSLKTKRFYLYDINSFGKISIYKQIARYDIYQHIELPNKIAYLVFKIVEHYLKVNSEIQKWPGGKRTKLPVARTM